MKRPIGITIIAMFLLLNGAVLTVLAATLYSHPDIGAGFSSAYLKHLFPIDRIDAAQMLWGWIVGGIVSFVIGVWLWFLNEYGWWAILIVAGIPLGRSLIAVPIALVMNSGVPQKPIPDGFWFRMIFYGVIVLYLTRPDVRNAFRGPDRYLQEFDPKPQDSREGP
ncbi:MAG: hypothetical protein WA532_04260 [Candidatus Korobacteraceae bacterium]